MQMFFDNIHIGEISVWLVVTCSSRNLKEKNDSSQNSQLNGLNLV